MKTKTLFIVVFSLLLCKDFNMVKAQERGGCDLCGPASGVSQNIVKGNYSATIGAGCEANGSYSLAVGNAAKSNASMTTAIGKYVRANATNSVIIGSGVSNSDTRALINSKANSLIVGFNSTYPTLFVGPSSGYGTTGKVAIGNVTTPESKLHVKSDVNEDAGIILETSTSSKSSYLQFTDTNHKISYDKSTGIQIMSKNDNITLGSNIISMNAKVGINTTNDFTDNYDYALAVSGGVLTDKILIKEVTEWYDIVFEDDYSLMSLKQLEDYIDQNGHLPEMPSAEEVKSEGYNMVDIDGLLLKKIEELTLYTIELNRLFEEQQRTIEMLQSK